MREGNLPKQTSCPHARTSPLLSMNAKIGGMEIISKNASRHSERTITTYGTLSFRSLQVFFIIIQEAFDSTFKEPVYALVNIYHTSDIARL